MALQVLLSCPYIDAISRFHEINRMNDKTGGETCLEGNVARMQSHVTTLDAFDTHSPQSCKILR